MSRRVGLRYMQSTVVKKRVPKWEGSTDSRYRPGSLTPPKMAFMHSNIASILDQPKMAFVHSNVASNTELQLMAFAHINVASLLDQALMALGHSNSGSIQAPYPP